MNQEHELKNPNKFEFTKQLKRLLRKPLKVPPADHKSIEETIMLQN